MDIIQSFLTANSPILSNSFWQQQYLINSFKNCSSQSTPLKILKTTGPVTLGKRLACWLLNDWFRSAIEMFYLNNLFKMLSCVSICSVQINSGSTLSWYQYWNTGTWIKSMNEKGVSRFQVKQTNGGILVLWRMLTRYSDTQDYDINYNSPNIFQPDEFTPLPNTHCPLTEAESCL